MLYGTEFENLCLNQRHSSRTITLQQRVFVIGREDIHAVFKALGELRRVPAVQVDFALERVLHDSLFAHDLIPEALNC